MALFRIDHTSECVSKFAPLYDCTQPLSLKKNRWKATKSCIYSTVFLTMPALGSAIPNIEILARERDLVVVMADGGACADMQNGQAYFTYLTEELPATSRLFSILTISAKIH